MKSDHKNPMILWIALVSICILVQAMINHSTGRQAKLLQEQIRITAERLTILQEQNRIMNEYVQLRCPP